MVSTLDYILFNSPKPNYSPYFTELGKWSLDNIHKELSSTSEGLKSLNGLFYTPSIKNSKLSQLAINYPELSGLKYSLENQMSTIK